MQLSYRTELNDDCFLKINKEKKTYNIYNEQGISIIKYNKKIANIYLPALFSLTPGSLVNVTLGSSKID